MTIAAVICEYNPFHNGHKYQLDVIRQKLKVDYIVLMMSGDFVERGEPALYSKELRTKWALENGADLVILLPLPYATGSADLFAYGAVYFLENLNCIDYLCFGSESGNIDDLYICAGKLLKEGQITSPEIKTLMKDGNTFAKARSILFPQFRDILAEPNNVLALEYIMHLIKFESSMVPFTHIREGEGYEDDTISDDFTYMSATAIRKALFDGNFSRITNYVPYDLNSIPDKPVSPDDLSMALYYSLLINTNSLNNYLEASEDLSKRIINNINKFESFSSFVDLLKTKNYTHSRISRALLHVMLNIDGSNTYYKQSIGHISCLRVLGFKESAAPLIREIAEKSKIKLITKVPDEYDKLNSITRQMLDYELFASTLYDSLSGNHTPEYSKKLTVI